LPQITPIGADLGKTNSVAVVLAPPPKRFGAQEAGRLSAR